MLFCFINCITAQFIGFLLFYNFSSHSSSIFTVVVKHRRKERESSKRNKIFILILTMTNYENNFKRSKWSLISYSTCISAFFCRSSVFTLIQLITLYLPSIFSHLMILTRAILNVTKSEPTIYHFNLRLAFT